MSLMNIFDIAGSGMGAQTVRLNATASNLANAQSTASSPVTAYKSIQPVFSTVLNEQSGATLVRIVDVTESDAESPMRYAPSHPKANEEGYVFGSNVDAMAELANMISASRSYQTNVEMLNTSKELLLSTLRLGE